MGEMLLMVTKRESGHEVAELVSAERACEYMRAALDSFDDMSECGVREYLSDGNGIYGFIGADGERVEFHYEKEV